MKNQHLREEITKWQKLAPKVKTDSARNLHLELDIQRLQYGFYGDSLTYEQFYKDICKKYGAKAVDKEVEREKETIGTGVSTFETVRMQIAAENRNSKQE